MGLSCAAYRLAFWRRARVADRRRTQPGARAARREPQTRGSHESVAISLAAAPYSVVAGPVGHLSFRVASRRLGAGSWEAASRGRLAAKWV